MGLCYYKKQLALEKQKNEENQEEQQKEEDGGGTTYYVSNDQHHPIEVCLAFVASCTSVGVMFCFTQEEIVFEELSTERPCVGLCQYYRSIGQDMPYRR